MSQLRLKVAERVQNDTLDALLRAETMVQGYFYDEAMPLLDELERNHPGEARILELKERCLTGRSNRAPYTGPIQHVFFHSLVADPGKAFDGDTMSNGYNMWMTTVDEFKKMLAQMHARGFILIDIHDMWETVTDSAGAPMLRKKNPLLPKGKKPLILSVDDINYYPFMENDGFADRLMLDAHGDVTARYWTNGTATQGDYDVVPILDHFVLEHPDFSYHGAKGILALTGYMGTLGYRTQQLDAPDYANRADEVRQVVAQLKRTGWLFGSHGYGHLHSAHITLQHLQSDTAKWKDEVGRLVGPTDIYVYPFGEEVPYPSDKLKALQDAGFKVFCGVGSQTFLQVKKDYIRQSRCNLDGYSLQKRPQRLEEFFTPQDVIDPARPALK